MPVTEITLMASTIRSLGIDRLSVEERLALVQEIWDGIATDPEQVPLTAPQKQELDRRLAAHEADPGDVVPWETVRDEALNRLRR